MIKRSDLSVVVFDGEGHISVISSNTRAALNENGGKNKLDYEEKDHDFLAELHRASGQFVPNVYQINISAKEEKSTIKTMNTQDDTVFVMRSDHTLSKVSMPGARWVPNTARGQKRQESLAIRKANTKKKQIVSPEQQQMVGDMELEETGNW